REVKRILSVFFKLAVLLLSVFLLAYNTSLATGKIIAVCLLIISFLNLWKSRNSIIFCVIFGFIFYCNYSVCMVNHFNILEGNFFTQWALEDISYKGIGVLYLFNVMLFMFIPSKKKMAKSTEISFFRKEHYNPIIAWGAIILAMSMWFLGFALSSDGGRGDVSPVYEYAIIIILFGFAYSGGKVQIVFANLLVVLFFCFFDLYSGNRAVAIQLVLMAFIILFSGGNKFKFKKVFPFLLLGLILFTIVGQIRGATSFNWETIVDAVNHISEESFSLDTAYSAYFTGLTFIQVAEEIAASTRLSMFGSFLLGIIKGFSAVENADLSSFTHEFYKHYYGGFLPSYFYFYLGILGIVLIALYLSFLFNRLGWNKSLYSKISITYIACTVPRWYLYSPSAIFRGLLFVTAVSIICYYFNRFIKVGKKKRKN
ncbi:MAG: hypothetical protein IJW47_01440, partial [Clostridia bacterium]|nr:hypothetical protein [Clostridia bacterium]